MQMLIKKFEKKYLKEIANKNDEQPHIVIRENAVDVKTPRERVVLGDEPDWGPIGNPPGKYRS